jgi:hypothetical protein
MSYYIAKVKMATDTPKGVKWQTEQHLVNAVSVTHAEALVTEYYSGTGIDFEVKSVSFTPIQNVISSKHE